jgi:4'-phosphopantetheinyl transferase
MRAVLSRYAGASPSQMRFSRGPHGRPSLAAPALPLDFNLTDSGDWLALAVSGGATVGIDLEYCDTRRDVLKLARRFFSASELADLRACGDVERVSRFYDYWTLKEARIKAAGGSLWRELETTAFALDFPVSAGGSAALGRIAPLAPTPGTPAWYCLLQPFEDYRLALCSTAPRDPGAGLRGFEMRGGDAVIERPLRLRAVSTLPQSAPEARRP